MNRTYVLGCGLVAALVLATGVAAGIGASAVERHYESRFGLQVEPPSACVTGGRDGCREAMGDARFGTLLSVPVAVWGTAAQLAALLASLVLAFGLALRADVVTAAAWVGVTTMAAVGVGASLGFLVILLAVMKTYCGLCVMMHAGNLVLLLLAIAASWVFWGGPRPALRALVARGRLVAPIAVLAAVALWLAGAYVVRAVYDARFGALATHRQANARLVARFDEVLAKCPEGPCPPGVRYAASVAPMASRSVVLRKAPGRPTIVEMIDLRCEHCREDFRTFEPHYRALLNGQDDLGLRVVPVPGLSSCAREAAAAFVCAARDGGGNGAKALDFMVEEFLSPRSQAEPCWDRGAWLAANVSAAARGCYDQEVKSDFPTLDGFADEGRRLQGAAQLRAECRSPQPPSHPWWCFEGTPSYGVFVPGAEAASLEDPTAVELARKADGELRWKRLRACTGVSGSGLAGR